MTKDETKVDPDDEASTRLFEETDDKEKKQPITSRRLQDKSSSYHSTAFWLHLW